MEDRPFIYLDQWALSMFSKQRAFGDRLLSVLQRGTLLLSTLNLLETARAKGPTAKHIASFLDSVGARWAPVALSTRTVQQREKEYRLDPWRDEIHLPHLLRAPSVAWKPGELARRLQEPWAAQTLSEWEQEAADISAHFDVARKRCRAGELQLDGFWDLPDQVSTKSVFATVAQRLVRGSLNLERHQIDDFMHTCVPVTYGDVVFLDRKTKQLLEGLETRARVFHAGELEDAFLWLEQRWSAMRDGPGVTPCARSSEARRA